MKINWWVHTENKFVLNLNFMGDPVIAIPTYSGLVWAKDSTRSKHGMEMSSALCSIGLPQATRRLELKIWQWTTLTNKPWRYGDKLIITDFVINTKKRKRVDSPMEEKEVRKTVMVCPPPQKKKLSWELLFRTLVSALSETTCIENIKMLYKSS